jgi:hypothetical protein
VALLCLASALAAALRLARHETRSRDGCVRQELAARVMPHHAWKGHEDQKGAIDDFARMVGVEVLTMPTGQGAFAQVLIGGRVSRKR